MRIAESFNKLSPEEVRPESACTYRLFQMQQTHMLIIFDTSSTNYVDISETLIVAELRGPQVEKTSRSLTKKNNVKAWGRKGYEPASAFH